MDSVNLEVLRTAAQVRQDALEAVPSPRERIPTCDTATPSTLKLAA